MIDYSNIELSSFDKFLYIECRQIILTILSTRTKYDNVLMYKSNHRIIGNYIKYDYFDYLSINNGKIKDYPSHKKLLDILEKNGYKLDIKLTLS